MVGKKQAKTAVALAVAVFSLCSMIPWNAAAGMLEYSLGFSFARSNYSEQDFSWRRTWGASVGYHFTERSGIEFSYQNVTERTQIRNYEDTTFNDQIYSISWVQYFAGKSFPIQPYLKGGVGQLNRDGNGHYGANPDLKPPSRVDSVSVVLGGGLRVFITKHVALRSELTSYLSGGSVRTYKDNISTTLGFSVYF